MYEPINSVLGSEPTALHLSSVDVHFVVTRDLEVFSAVARQVNCFNYKNIQYTRVIISNRNASSFSSGL